MRHLLPLLAVLLTFSCQTNTKKQVNQASATVSETANLKHQPDTLLNTQDYLIVGEQQAEVKVIKATELNNYPSYEVLTEYQADLIIGKNTTRDALHIYKKYRPTTSFEEHPAEVYQGKLAEPDFTSDPDAKNFITRIKAACDEGINFAGHYTLIIWGCGSPCQSGVVVDRKTGKIYGGYQTSLGSDFRKDSKLIIMNTGAIDPETNLIELCSYCTVSEEVWTGKEFNPIN